MEHDVVVLKVVDSKVPSQSADDDARRLRRLAAARGAQGRDPVERRALVFEGPIDLQGTSVHKTRRSRRRTRDPAFRRGSGGRRDSTAVDLCGGFRTIVVVIVVEDPTRAPEPSRRGRNRQSLRFDRARFSPPFASVCRLEVLPLRPPPKSRRSPHLSHRPTRRPTHQDPNPNRKDATSAPWTLDLVGARPPARFDDDANELLEDDRSYPSPRAASFLDRYRRPSASKKYTSSWGPDRRR